MDITKLEAVMVKYGVVIRALPVTVRRVYEAGYKGEFPEGELKYLEPYKREMLVVEKPVPEGYAGKFIIELCPHTDSQVRFTAPKRYDSIEQAIEDLERMFGDRQD